MSKQIFYSIALFMFYQIIAEDSYSKVRNERSKQIDKY